MAEHGLAPGLTNHRRETPKTIWGRVVQVLERNHARRILASAILVTAVPARWVPGAAAQEMRSTSYVTKSGERVLRIETVVPASTENVWKAWTAPQELSKWIAPVVAIDLKIGARFLRITIKRQQSETQVPFSCRSSITSRSNSLHSRST